MMTTTITQYLVKIEHEADGVYAKVYAADDNGEPGEFLRCVSGQTRDECVTNARKWIESHEAAKLHEPEWVEITL